MELRTEHQGDDIGYVTSSVDEMSAENFELLEFPETARPWFNDPLKQFWTLHDAGLKEFDSFCFFLGSNLSAGNFQFLKIHDSSDPFERKSRVNSTQHYLSVRGPDSVGANRVYIRIDQDWRRFETNGRLPDDVQTYFKEVAYLFSGMAIGALELPPVILEQDLLGDASYGYQYTRKKLVNPRPLRKVLESMYLISINYSDVASLINGDGEVIQWFTNETQKFSGGKAADSLQIWLRNELGAHFPNSPPPNWGASLQC